VVRTCAPPDQVGDILGALLPGVKIDELDWRGVHPGV
jgi:hypothetical protein